MSAVRSSTNAAAANAAAQSPAAPSSPAAAPEQLTAPVEDYLKAIYEMERAGGAAATNDLAQHLGVAPASVSGMVRRLAEQGYLAHERYHGVRLTAAGRTAALRTLRRHRVIEAYLVHALGYPWDRVHDEAERMEHAASDELVDRMAAAMGEPAVDPHGAPIPARDGSVDETPYRSLAELPAGATGRVVRVRDEDPEMLRYLAELGVRPGARITLVARAPFDGPLTLRVVEPAPTSDRAATARGDHAVGTPLARHVLVAEISEPAGDPPRARSRRG